MPTTTRIQGPSPRHFLVLMGIALTTFLVTFFSPPAHANSLDVSPDGLRHADLAVAGRILNEDPSGTIIEATITNNGPQTSYFPLLAVHIGEAVLLGHDGDPTPGSTHDGVACETTAPTIQCTYGQLVRGQEVRMHVRVKVPKPTKAIVVTRAQQTNDPVPVANNRVEIPLQPTHATVQAASQTDAGEPTAAQEAITWTIQHSDGRPAPIKLRVRSDRPISVVAPACPITPGNTPTPITPQTPPTGSVWRSGQDRLALPKAAPLADHASPNGRGSIQPTVPPLAQPASIAASDQTNLSLDEGSALPGVVVKTVPMSHTDSGHITLTPDQPWLCTVTQMKPGQTQAVTLLVDKPKPGQPGVTMHLDAKADLPQAQMVSTTVAVGAREGIRGQMQRLFGAERAETAANISQQRFVTGHAKAIILARGDEPADALTGAPLAVKEHAPVLLTGSQGIPDVTQAEIDRLGGSRLPVILLGGPVAISQGVEAQLRRAGHVVTRLAGPTRTETAAAIAQRIGPGPRLVADGFTADEAVIAAATMAANGGAVLLTAGDVLPASVAQAVRQADAAVGVRAGQASGLKTFAATTPTDTAISVAKAYFPQPNKVIVARAGLPADALAGGALAGDWRAPLIVVNGQQVSASLLEWVNTMPITQLTVLGGPTAISDHVANQLVDAMIR